MFTLFQIMTLESWSMGIVRPVMEAYSWAWIVFVAFIVLSSFTVLNFHMPLSSIPAVTSIQKGRNRYRDSDVVHSEHLDRATQVLN